MIRATRSGGVLVESCAQPVEAHGTGLDVRGIVEAVADDDVHHAEGERRIRAGSDLHEPIGEGSGAVPMHVDMHERGTVPLRLADVRHLVHVGGDDVGAPRDDIACVGRRLGVGSAVRADGHVEAGIAGGGTDGARELAGSEAIEEAPIHTRIVDDAHRARETVWKHGVRAMLIDDAAKTVGNERERIVPG